MKNALQRIIEDSEDDCFRKQLLAILIESGHGLLLAEHVLAAYLANTNSEPHKKLALAGKQPEKLARIVIDQIPEVEIPALPPACISPEAFSMSLLESIKERGVNELGEVLTSVLSPTLIKIFSMGKMLQEVADAFRVEDTKLPEEFDKAPGPRFFKEDGSINQEIFTENALKLIVKVAHAATELGYEKITLPVFFYGLIQEGILRDYLVGFSMGYETSLYHLKIKLAKISLTEKVIFSKSTISSQVNRYIEFVEKMAGEKMLKIIDEVLLVLALCRLESNMLKGYWQTFGVDALSADKMIQVKKDESLANQKQENPGTAIEQIRQLLESRIIGQSEAIEQTIPVIRKWMMKFYLNDRPTGVILFMGPPGVGKTELSKELAGILYNDRTKFCFIEMNSMAQSYTVSKLIGSAPGLVGPDSGMLTDWIANNPESIILFDEIEKAHEDCFNILLRLLNEGRIGDAAGKEYDATKCLILLTSNIGQSEGFFDRLMDNPVLKAEIYKNPLKSDEVKDLLAKTFKAEFISRLSNVVIFNPLQLDDYQVIARLAAVKLVGIYQEKFAIEAIEFDPEVFKHLATEAKQQAQGARGVISRVNGSLNDQLLIHVSNHPKSKNIRIRCRENTFEIIG